MLYSSSIELLITLILTKVVSHHTLQYVLDQLLAFLITLLNFIYSLLFP